MGCAGSKGTEVDQAEKPAVTVEPGEAKPGDGADLDAPLGPARGAQRRPLGTSVALAGWAGRPSG